MTYRKTDYVLDGNCEKTTQTIDETVEYKLKNDIKVVHFAFTTDVLIALQDAEAGYTCECEPGFVFRSGKCEDIKECVFDATLCNGGECVDTDGSFYCINCPDGYDGDRCQVST